MSRSKGKRDDLILGFSIDVRQRPYNAVALAWLFLISRKCIMTYIYRYIYLIIRGLLSCPYSFRFHLSPSFSSLMRRRDVISVSSAATTTSLSIRRLEMHWATSVLLCATFCACFASGGVVLSYWQSSLSAVHSDYFVIESSTVLYNVDSCTDPIVLSGRAMIPVCTGENFLNTCKFDNLKGAVSGTNYF